MTFADVVFTALQQLKENKLRSFFTLLGIIVSVTLSGTLKKACPGCRNR